MTMNIKSYVLLFLFMVFNVSCGKGAQNEGNQCLANVGQPCTCTDNTSGKWQCTNNQPYCDCGQNVSGSGGSGGSLADTGTAGTGGTGAGSGGTGGAGTITVTDAGPKDSGGQIPTDAKASADSSDSSNPDSNLPITGRFPPVGDVWAQGPYTPVTVNNTGPNNAYTLFHPQELAPNGVLNPIVTWGNGATTNPSMYPKLLPHLAEHGFVVIAANNTMVTAEELRAGIDWLIEQNQTPGSAFYQKLDENNVAAMGYSLGSLRTFAIADDPRLTTTVHISGGASGSADVAKLRQMTAFFCDEQQTAPNCQPDFNIAPVPVFYGVFLGTNHVGTMLDPYISRIAGATTGWLRWRLMADESQKALFVGSDCTLCKDPNWTVQQKDLQ